MTSERDKNLGEEASKSPFFEYVVEKTVEERISALVRRWRWFAGAVLSLVAIIVGINYSSFLQMKKKYEETSAHLTQLLTEQLQRTVQLSREQADITAKLEPIKQGVPELSKNTEQLSADGTHLRSEFVSLSTALGHETDLAMQHVGELEKQVDTERASIFSFASEEKAAMEHQVAECRTLLGEIRADTLLVSGLGSLNRRLAALEQRGENARFDVEAQKQKALNEIDQRASDASDQFNSKREKQKLDQLSQKVDQLASDLDKLKAQVKGANPSAMSVKTP